MRKAIEILQDLTERVADLLCNTITVPPCPLFRDLTAEAHFLRQRIAEAEADSSSTSVYEDVLEYVTFLETRDAHCRANKMLDSIDFDFEPTLFPRLYDEGRPTRNSNQEGAGEAIARGRESTESTPPEENPSDSGSGSHTSELCYT
jgi:hypothetical protein